MWVLVLYIPIVMILILTIIYPEEMFMCGRRWQFKDGAEPSESVIKINRIIAIVILIIIFLAILYEIIT